MGLLKETKSFGLLAESQYGYVEGVKVDQIISIFGQLSHDEEGDIVGEAPLDNSGHIADHSKMKVQMHHAYGSVNGFLLKPERHSTTLLEEFYMPTDIDQAFVVDGLVRGEAYGVAIPQGASTILVTPRRAL